MSENEPADSPKLPLAETVVRGLRDAIVSGRLQPGERIKQGDVAAEFGVSRSPVREAFRELASEGFVELLPDVGARVSRITRSSLHQLYLGREALEPILIAETAIRITDDALRQAREIDDRARESAGRGDIASYLLLDSEMHLLLLRSAGLDLLYETAVSFWQRTAPHRLAYSDPNRLELSMVEHRMLLDALERRSPEDAADIYRMHTRHTRVALSQTELDDPTED